MFRMCSTNRAVYLAIIDGVTRKNKCARVQTVQPINPNHFPRLLHAFHVVKFRKECLTRGRNTRCIAMNNLNYIYVYIILGG